MAARSNRSAANAGFHSFFLQPAKRRSVSANFALPERSQASIEAAGNNQSTGGVVLAIGKNNTAAFALVVTVTGTLTEEPAATETGEAGALQAALAGAPVQVTVTLKGFPVAASCRAYEADWPALMVTALPPGGTVRERLPAGAFTVIVAVLLAVAPLLSVTVAFAV